jgi:hypothetical protein
MIIVLGNIVIYGSDLNRHQRIEGNTIRLCINCTTQAELEGFFWGLSAGGQATQSIEAALGNCLRRADRLV